MRTLSEMRGISDERPIEDRSSEIVESDCTAYVCHTGGACEGARRPFLTLSIFPIGICLFPIERKNPCLTLSETGNFRSEISDEQFSMRTLSEMRGIFDEGRIENRSSEIV